MNYQDHQELKKELEQLEDEAKMQELLKEEDLRAVKTRHRLEDVIQVVQRLYNRVAALEERLDELEEAQDTQEIPQGVNIVVQEGAIVIGRVAE
jgi:ubiquinone biosynthesis protein UbiJ